MMSLSALLPLDSQKFEKSWLTTKTNEASGWSDDEKQPGNGGGEDHGQRDKGNGFRGRRESRRDGGYRGRRDDGGESGYRGRRDDGEGGYRGRRDDGGEGGFRGRREGGEEGGYRGRRDNGDGGGYRGRREDGEDGGFRGRRGGGDNEDVPSSYDKESVESFIKGIDLNSPNQSLAKLREQRDYLLTAFTQLVNSEWTSLEEKRRDERKQKALELRDTVADGDRIIAEINRLISDAEDERQQFRAAWLTNDVDTFVVPNAPRTQQQRSQEITTPTTPALRTTRRTLTPTQTPRTAASADQVVDAIDLNDSIKLHRLRKLLKTVRRDYESTDGNEMRLEKQQLNGMQ
ncbi:hypothetical protein ACLKA6_012225 [Drosophila palustris]